jgi:glucose-6-phosphate dehydrogenase assembly protein OpcA
MKVALDRVEHEVTKLWEAEATPSPRVELLTLVALVAEPRLRPRAAKVLEHVARVYPCRTIAALWHPEGAAVIDADVSLHRTVARAPCGDSIVLEAHGPARGWLPENIDRLLLPGLPVCVWWLGDLPDFDDLFDRTVRRADAVVVDSSDMDLRDLEKLSRIVRLSGDQCALADLAWVRLRSFQDLLARFFDDRPVRGWLDGLHTIDLAYAPRPKNTDVASTQAGLLVGWLAAALGFRVDSVQWHKGDEVTEAIVTRTGSQRAVTIRFQGVERHDVRDGCVLRVELHCSGANGHARFEIARQSDPCMCLWRCDVPGLVVPSQMLSVGIHEESSLLVRYLERPARDPLFEASLHAGSTLVRPVAPRLSSFPPKAI